MASVILGTAGHIDHGKTALVGALTGVDTDRLKEEKARGITIELGFAELAVEGRPHFGVVDVPGHEAFVRAMVAGAAGMDVVLLVVAADEGVMPQTREHLSIVELLGVPELVVAITKCDASDEEWLELVEADVDDVLSSTRYAGARRVRTSATEGTGLDDLLDVLQEAAERVGKATRDDLARLPLDRVFTIQGTGTVATGTLWSGALATGARVRVLPGDLEGRVRSLQVHGRTADRAEAGDRTAVALAGDGGDRERVERGAVLVTDPAWEESWMLTTRVRLLSDTAWSLEHNQRVHVHHGTAQVLARCAFLDGGAIAAGEAAWVQLRLEEPLVARAGDRLVLRAYSPVTTIGGGIVAEPRPPKRNRVDEREQRLLSEIMDGSAVERTAAAVALAGWDGVPVDALPVVTGLVPSAVAEAVETVRAHGDLMAGQRLVSRHVRDEAERLVLEAVDRGHEDDPLRAGVPLARVRGALPTWAPTELADAVVEGLCGSGQLDMVGGDVRRRGFEPELTPDQQWASSQLLEALGAEGLAAPQVEELAAELTGRRDFWPLLRHLESMGAVRQVADGLYVPTTEIDAAIERIRAALGGREGLGPADFREVLPVSRKHLIPLLNYFDGVGVTHRHPDGRMVPAE